MKLGWIVGLIFWTAIAQNIWAQTSPLVMRHADSLAVMRKVGFLLLDGRVRFTHDSIEFRTQRATWNKNIDRVDCNGNFLFTHPDGYIQAKTGSYQRKTEIATAKGNVEAKDSAGTYAFFGNNLVYDKKKKFLTLTEKPLLYQYQAQKDGKIDTTAVRAERITFDQNAEFAEAFKNVVITQGTMIVTCDTGYLDKKNSWVSLKGSPKFTMDGYELTGDSIYLTVDADKRTLKSALVIRNAKGKQHEKGKKGKPDQFTEAEGDTLYAEFAGDKIQSLYVNLNALGTFYEDDFKNYRNSMEGSRLDLTFLDGKLQGALISGDAQSTYFHIAEKKRQIEGKNEAAGDTIRISFDAGQVKHLTLAGTKALASGRYIDLSKQEIYPIIQRDSSRAKLSPKDSTHKISDKEISAADSAQHKISGEKISQLKNSTPKNSTAKKSETKKSAVKKSSQKSGEEKGTQP